VPPPRLLSYIGLVASGTVLWPAGRALVTEGGKLVKYSNKARVSNN